MTLPHRFASILRWIVRRTPAERALDDELRAYLDLAIADKVRDGTAPAEARRLAILELGGIEQTKERVRTYRHGGLLDEVGRDVRQGFRMFGAHKVFTAVVVITLALGIGANTAIFSLMDALMLRWLPVRDPQDLVQVTVQTADGHAPDATLSYALARALDEEAEPFAGAAGFSAFPMQAGRPGSLETIQAAVVTGAFYETLGLSATIGRLLARDDDRPGAAPVGVISDGYWARQFGRSPSALGRPLLMNGVPVTIVGVSPRGFVGANVGSTADVTIAVAAISLVAPQAAPLLTPGNFWLRVLARPRPGVSRAQAETRLNAIWPRVVAPAIPAYWPAARRRALADAVCRLTPGGTGWTFLREMYVRPLRVLMAVVALVLVIACANVASLLLARASARQREIGVRLALGASRGRIVRQLLIESTMLSSIGGGLGVAVAWASGTFLVRMISPGRSEIVFDLAPNAHILAFTSAVAIATGICFGLVPAVQTTAIGVAPVLRDGMRITGARSRLLPVLVGGQVALSLMLLVAAALFVRTLWNLRAVDVGFRADGVLLVDLEGQRTPLLPGVVEQVRAIPGVTAVSVSTHTPLSGSIWSEPAVPAGQTIPERDNAYFVGAGPGFFATMQIPMLDGREFADRDSADREGVAVVNERFAERHFGKENPIGRHLAARVRNETRDLRIVGIAKNTNAGGLRRPPPPTVYVSYAQLKGSLPTTIEARVDGTIGRASADVRRVLQSLLPDTALDIHPLSAQIDATTVQERMMAMLATAFGALALALACIGLYGLLAYSVVRETKEIGIRMALGAPRRRVLAQVVNRAIGLVTIGIAVGLPAAWAAARWVRSLLFGVTPTDAPAAAAATALLMTAALVAAGLPAWRASHVNPLDALRHE